MQLSLVLLLPPLTAVLGFVVATALEAHAANDPLVVGRLGRMEALALEANADARLVIHGDDRDGPLLHSVVQRFDRDLSLLVRGTPTTGATVGEAPLPDGDAEPLVRMWTHIRGHLLALAAGNLSPAERVAAEPDLLEDTAALGEALGSVSRGVSQGQGRAAKGLVHTLGGIVGVDLLVLLIGLVYAERRIIGPLLRAEHRLADEALASEQSLRDLVDASPDAMAVHRDGRIAYVNQSLVVLLGYDQPEDLLDLPSTAIVHPDDRAAVAGRITDIGRTGAPVVPKELRFLRRDGSVAFVESLGLPLSFDGRPAVVSMARDLTERRKLMTKMFEMDRMIAVGTLAAGVGHEINNPLAYVISNLDYLAEELPAVLNESSNDTGEILDVVREAREGTDRVRRIVRDLKSFSRGDAETSAPVDVRKVLDSAVQLSWNEIRHRALLEKDYDDVPDVLGDEGRLGQVFVNLLVNAAQAIGVGKADRNFIHLRVRLERGGVAVEVEDSGGGIAPEHKGQLFDPFFTTKPVGTGTGLGLAITQHIVEAHQGTISVQSTPGLGTTFTVWLPAATDATADAPSTPPVHLPPPCPECRILVVDDEPLVGRAIGRALGARPSLTVVERARDALALLRRDERYDVVFCDLMMPEMSGMDLYAAVSALDPEQASRFVFVTGGAFTPRARSFLDSVANRCIDKPFDLDTIRSFVAGIGDVTAIGRSAGRG